MPVAHQQAAGQELFNALADPTRRNILELLATKGQMSATDIYDNFNMSHPAVSQHLKVLRKAEIVRLEKNAQRRFYSLNTDTMHQLEDWIAETTKLWDERFGRMDKVLEEEKEKELQKGGD